MLILPAELWHEPDGLYGDVEAFCQAVERGEMAIVYEKLLHDAWEQFPERVQRAVRTLGGPGEVLV